MLNQALEEIRDDLELWFAPDPITGERLPSMLVVASAMVIEIVFGIIMLMAIVS